MATPVTFNGSSYSVPAYGDSGWAQGAGNLSSYLIAIASGCLQTTGGAFTLSAEVDFGATYGVKGTYFKTETASPATVGVLRLALSDTIAWGASNLALAVSGSRLQFNGQTLLIASDLPTTVVEYREVYVAGTALNNYTGSLTVVNMVGSYSTNGANLTVSVNGLVQDVGASFDYQETSTTSITFNASLTAGDRISLRWAVY
jgi:hypothetical protein